MIPEGRYKEILKEMPICCVDLIITYRNKSLILKRANKPAKGKWWLPGGRILKNETIKHAAIRKAKEEAGLDCNFIKKLGVYETIFKDGPFGLGIHTINVLCLLKAKTNKVRLDSAHTEYKWSDKTGKDLDKMMVRFLKGV